MLHIYIYIYIYIYDISNLRVNIGSDLSKTSYNMKLQRSALSGASIDRTTYVHAAHVLVVLSTVLDYKVN